MLGPILLLQLATVRPDTAHAYSSAALETFIATAAEQNRRPPLSLRGYRARIESELSLILRDTLGRENVAQVEELALVARWRRSTDYTLHVVGYRSESVGVPYSALSFARTWTVPVLYGDRLTFGVDVARDAELPKPSGRQVVGNADTTGRRSRSSVVTEAVHPLALDRDRFYRFSGGDTVAFLRSGQHVIPISRVRVTPILGAMPRDTSVTVFEGEIDFDATRAQIVRMRGRFIARRAPERGIRERLSALSGVTAVAFIEFVNAEVEGRYWLPQFQRTEFQASVALLGNQRSVFRLVSHFSDFSVEEEPVPMQSGALRDSTREARLEAEAIPRDSGRAFRRALTYAGGDTIGRYREWTRPLGTATSEAAASDFDDFLPDPWRPDGPPRFELAPQKLDEIFRFDRVEGSYTGAAVGLRFRDAFPGLTARSWGGWAWSEQTARGGASILWAHGGRTLSARVERRLASTNDFADPLDAGTIGPAGLFGVDDQDYVDRREAVLGLTSATRSAGGAIVSLEGGAGEDRREVARIAHGALGAGTFRDNRASMDGRYVRAAATVELHPSVTGLFLEPGAGLVASYEVGHGQLNWQRSELTLALRRTLADIMISGRLRAGVVAGGQIPPQQLFELGGEGALPGYGYKEFAGDRAAAAGMLASYQLPLLRRPWRLIRALIVPGIGPGFAVGIQSGWTEASSSAVLAAIRRLDPMAPAACAEAITPSCPAAISTSTDGVRATVDARLTLFGGLIGVGVARPIDSAAAWRFVFRFGQEY